MAPKKMQSGSDCGKKVIKKMTIELQRKLLANMNMVFECLISLCSTKPTISIILKNKDAVKAADVAKGVTILTKLRPQEEVEKCLLVWINTLITHWMVIA